MISQISNIPDSLNEVLQKIYNILIGSGSTSFLALASAVALIRTGLNAEEILYARRNGFHNSLPNEEIEIAVKIMSKLFDRLSDEKFKQILDALEHAGQMSFSHKEWGAAFDICMGKFKPVMGKSSVLVQPKELVQLVTSIYKVEVNATVYSPFSGGCCIATHLPDDVSFTADELKDETWAIGKLRLNAYGLNNAAKLRMCDPALTYDGKIYDHILSFPPFEFKSSRYSNEFAAENSADAILLAKCIPAVNSGSKLVMVVPYWSLSDRNNYELRKQLVDNDMLEAVISLPGNIYTGSSYSVGILCLNKSKTEKNKILFYNGEDQVSDNTIIDVETVLKVIKGKKEVNNAKYVSSVMVQKRGYYLDPNWHLTDIEHGLQETDNIVRLRSVATKLEGKFRSDAATLVDRILIRDLCDDVSDFEFKQKASQQPISREDYATIVDEPCLLIALSGYSLKPTWFRYAGNLPICIGSEMCALKIDTSKIGLYSLVSELHSSFVKHQFSVMKGGTPSITESELLSIEIRLP